MPEQPIAVDADIVLCLTAQHEFAADLFQACVPGEWRDYAVAGDLALSFLYPADFSTDILLGLIADRVLDGDTFQACITGDRQDRAFDADSVQVLAEILIEETHVIAT